MRSILLYTLINIPVLSTNIRVIIYFQVNSVSVEIATHDEVVQALKNAGEKLTLTVKHFKQASYFLNRGMSVYVTSQLITPPMRFTRLIYFKFSTLFGGTPPSSPPLPPPQSSSSSLIHYFFSFFFTLFKFLTILLKFSAKK